MPNKFNPLKTRYRASFAAKQFGADRLGKIDKENEILHDVQITLEGEAKGHGVYLDREFCEAVAEAGNATGDVGLKVRYGHPAMCSDAIGTELGRAKNFRVVEVEREIDGEKVTAAGVIADIEILKSAHSAPQGDIAAHVLAVAEEDPGQFGQSIVFTYSDWVVKDKDGNRHSYEEEVSKPFAKWNEEHPDALYSERLKKSKELYDAWIEQSADGKLYAVLGKLHGTDFTDTPAATDGIFSTGTLAEEAEQMLDEHPQILEVLNSNPKSVVEFLERTGLAEKIESARVSGLQAAKDKEIAELRAALSDMQKNSLEALASLENDKNVEIAALKEANAKFETDIAEKVAALDALNGEVEQLKATVSEVTTALEKSQAALEASENRYREQVGLALTQPKNEKPVLHGREKALASAKVVD